MWITSAKIRNCTPAKIEEAEAILDDMEEWRKANPKLCKDPD